MSTTCRLCSGYTAYIYTINNYSIYQCASCKTGQTIADEFAASQFYNKDYYEGNLTDGYGSYAADKHAVITHYQHLYKYIYTELPTARDVLEVGCAYGFFLEAVSGKLNVIGTDVSLHAVTQASSDIRGRVAVVDFAHLQATHRFDIIAIFDTIEHVSDPTQLMKQTSTFLKPGGIAIITTGAFDSVHARIFGRHWRLMTPPQHLFFLTRQSITTLARESGLSIKRMSYNRKHVSVRLALYQLGRIIPWSRSVISLIPKHWCVPINLYDVYTIVLEKPDLIRI